jgi:hypothetical protein
MNLRLVRLYPEQVARYWDFLSPLIEVSLPPITSNREDRMLKVLESILSGNMDVVQFFYVDEEGNVTARAFAVVAAIATIDGTGKQLLVYSIYGYESITRSEIVQGLKLLVDYAKGQGCDALTAYTNLSGLVEYFKRIGGSSSYTFIRLEV